MMISEIPTRFRAFQKDESPPQTGRSAERESECREHESGRRPGAPARPRPVPRPRLPRRAASEGPAFLWNGLLNDNNSSPSVNQYFVDYGRSAHVDRSRSLR